MQPHHKQVDTHMYYSARTSNLHTSHEHKVHTRQRRDVHIRQKSSREDPTMQI